MTLGQTITLFYDIFSFNTFGLFDRSAPKHVSTWTSLFIMDPLLWQMTRGRGMMDSYRSVLHLERLQITVNRRTEMRAEFYLQYYCNSYFLDLYQLRSNLRGGHKCGYRVVDNIKLLYPVYYTDAPLSDTVFLTPAHKKARWDKLIFYLVHAEPYYISLSKGGVWVTKL